MTNTAQTIDQAKLDEFMGRFVGDLGAAVSSALVVIGDKLGPCRAMGDGQPLTPEELAARTGTDARYVREWLSNQAAGGYVSYDPDAEQFFLTPEQSLALAQERSPARLEDNLNPVGRVCYGASTLVCTPASRDQEVGLALGAQAGEAQLGEVVTAGGFTRFRRATETPFNLVLEARP